MVWEKIQQQYPNQWVSIRDIERGNDGAIIAGVVVAAGPDLPSLVEASKGHNFSSHQFKYTGTITNFLGFSKWTIDNAHTR